MEPEGPASSDLSLYLKAHKSKEYLPITSSLLGSSSVELNLIYCPHGSLYVFQTYKAFMEAEIMSDGILNKKGMQETQCKCNQMFSYTCLFHILKIQRHLICKINTFQVAALRLKYAKFLVNQL